MPPLTFPEALETTRLYALTGLLPPGQALLARRPFRVPHHSVSGVGLMGGTRVACPAGVSVDHQGVLVLDELPEIRHDALEGAPRSGRANRREWAWQGGGSFKPCRLSLLARPIRPEVTSGSAEYPICNLHGCPCGHFGDLVHSCSCSSPQIARYLARISGPLLDRIDIQIEVPRLPHEDLLSLAPGESSAAVRERVCAARAIQQARFGGASRRGGAGKGGTGVFANGAMGARQIRQHCRMGEAAKELLRAAIQQLGLSARAYDRILKLARTVADLAGSEGIEVEHVAEAIQYRTLDRKLWG